MAARAMPIGFWTHIWMAKKIMLLYSAFQKFTDHLVSVKRRMKLSKPTKLRSLPCIPKKESRSYRREGLSPFSGAGRAAYTA